MATRRRRGRDGISFEHRGPCHDPHRHRHCPGLWRGELTTGYTGDGKRQRRKVSGTTKAAVIDKLRDLRTQLDKGITPKPGYVHYTVRQAAEDWLAGGLDGRSAKTVTKNRNVLAPISEGHRRPQAPRPLGSRRPAGAGRDGRRYSTAAVSMGDPRARSGRSGTPKPATWSPATSCSWPTPPKARTAGLSSP